MKSSLTTVFKKIFTTLKNFYNSRSWFEIIFLIVGFISIVSLLVIIFVPFGKGPVKITYTGEITDIENPLFLEKISRSLGTPYRQGEEIGILNNGDRFLASLLNDIDNSKLSINMMTFIWQDGKMSDAILDHLEKKLQEGVQVRILYDTIGSGTKFPDQRMKNFIKLGGKVEPFHSLTIVPWQLIKNQKRNHRRALVIDGSIAYTGGMTVADEWLGDARSIHEYRDIMFRVTGPLAQDLQGTFSELWLGMTGELISGDVFYPPLPKKALKNSYTVLNSTPSPDTISLQKFYLITILAAKHSLYITVPYFLPNSALSEALVQKAKEGVDVRILVPNILNDSRMVYYASRFHYDQLLEGGVKIYEYQPTFIHAKVMIADTVWTVFGSANFDNLSRKVNEEVVVGTLDPNLSSSLNTIFIEDTSPKNSVEIDYSTWKKRNWWQRFRELTADIFFQQF